LFYLLRATAQAHSLSHIHSTCNILVKKQDKQFQTLT